jgi:hypothetical protein
MDKRRAPSAFLIYMQGCNADMKAKHQMLKMETNDWFCFRILEN